MTDTPPGAPDPGQQPGAMPPPQSSPPGGSPTPPPPPPAIPNPPPPAGHAAHLAGQYGYGKPPKSKMTAGLLGIFLGAFGVHRFYLGFTGLGVAQIAVTVFTCGLGSLWGVVEGILILTGSIDRDADGQLLVD